jgi:hypothetical protein
MMTRPLQRRLRQLLLRCRPARRWWMSVEMAVGDMERLGEAQPMAVVVHVTGGEAFLQWDRVDRGFSGSGEGRLARRIRRNERLLGDGRLHHSRTTAALN